MRGSIIIAVIAIVGLVVVGYFFIGSNYPKDYSDRFGEDKIEGVNENAGISDIGWRDFDLKDISSGEMYRVSDFDKPILLESFAVWCPTCTKQQKVIKDLHDEIGDSVVSISLDTDPNEDEERVREHITKNGFDWYYSVAPIELTQGLIDEFGVGIVNAPSAPVILICPDGSAEQLDRGVKSVEDLKSAVNSC